MVGVPHPIDGEHPIAFIVKVKNAKVYEIKDQGFI